MIIFYTNENFQSENTQIYFTATKRDLGNYKRIKYKYNTINIQANTINLQ